MVWCCCFLPGDFCEAAASRAEQEGAIELSSMSPHVRNQCSQFGLTSHPMNVEKYFTPEIYIQIGSGTVWIVQIKLYIVGTFYPQLSGLACLCISIFDLNGDRFCGGFILGMHRVGGVLHSAEGHCFWNVAIWSRHFSIILQYIYSILSVPLQLCAFCLSAWTCPGQDLQQPPQKGSTTCRTQHGGHKLFQTGPI